jgi:hypothetical protein
LRIKWLHGCKKAAHFIIFGCEHMIVSIIVA